MWVSQIRDFAYEAEDIVESYIHGVSHHHTRNGKNNILNAVKRGSCLMVNAPKLHEVGSEIENLTLKISKLNKRLKSYGVDMRRIEDRSSQYSARIRDLRKTHSRIVEKDLIRRDKYVSELVGELINPERKNIVGIVGMGGLGKTTLAREVYRDRAVSSRFERFAWVCVSQQADMRSILMGALRGLDKERERWKLSKMSDEEMYEMVQKEVRERRCLVVLDDIWYQGSWILQYAFQSITDSGSKLLLTTRNKKAVIKVDPDAFIVKPKLLNKDESWKLLRKKAFPNSNDDDEIAHWKEELGRKMLKHCRGLPIAIVALGGILATKKTVDEWEKVRANIGVYLTKETDQQDNRMGVTEMMELSYNDLPFYLKPCFLYLGSFPEDAEIPTHTLYQLWQAEGLVQPLEDNELEVPERVCMHDIAEQYLDELVKRYMVDAEELYENEMIKTCRMHDVMRDFCLKKSKKEKFFEVVGAIQDDLVSSTQVWRAHRAAVHLRDDKSADSFFKLQENGLQLRSLTIDLPRNYIPKSFGVWFVEMNNAFKLLRVLCLQCVQIKKLPPELESCIHLRYLSFQLIHEGKVPSVIWKLGYLQTLDLGHIRSCMLIPDKLQKLKRLVHLYMPETYKVTRKLRLSQPRHMETLVNIDLKHFHEDDLKEMTYLRFLSFKNSVMDSECLNLAVNSPIITTRLLENPVSTLTIDVEAINQDPKILSTNDQVCIKVLKINGIIKARLEDVVLPRTIVSLELCDSEVEGGQMRHLKIHELKDLYLGKNTIRGNKIVFSAESFPELKKLTLEWHISSEVSEVEGALPNHCEFKIRCLRDNRDKISKALRHLRHNSDRLQFEFYS